MTTHPITRPTSTVERRRDHLRALAANAAPPDPHAVFWFLCQRCGREFCVAGIARQCVPCVTGAQRYGIVGSEVIGEAGAA